MKHAFFTILYNELPFLKQKMKFLYDNFEQLIFYDLHAEPNDIHFSTDGSHEFIKKYPDPYNKITLIERTNLNDVQALGVSKIIKQKMFSYGSEFVNDDIDLFWCFDMDEFFHKSLISKVEDVYNKNDIQSININHYSIWKNRNFILTDNMNDSFYLDFAVRITKHEKGNKYGHCSLGTQYPKIYMIDDEKIYHFAFFGNERVKFKMKYYGNKNSYYSLFKNFNYDIDKGNKRMHPDISRISYVKKMDIDFPDYINLDELEKDLK